MALQRRRISPQMTTLAAVSGALAGVGGVTHGIGELLQGFGPPSGIVFESWVHGPIATNLGGEPAMSLIPDIRVSGIVTIAVSLAVIAWSVAKPDQRHAGAVLALLSGGMLLVGGGFGPPILGMLAGLVAGAAHSTNSRLLRLVAGPRRQRPAGLWPGLFWLCTVNAAFLVVGSLVVGGLLGLAAPDLFVASLFLVVVTMPLAAIAGMASRAKDASPSAPPTPVPERQHVAR